MAVELRTTRIMGSIRERVRKQRRLMLGVLLLAVVAGSALPAAAESRDVQSLTQRMMAVVEVVSSILGYARWPDAVPPLQLCVAGPTEYADMLLQTGNGSPHWEQQVLRIKVDDPAIGQQCDALYIGVVEQHEQLELLSRLHESHVLTIIEQDEDCTSGSMFCLDIGEDFISFEINLDAVARSGVRVNPRVLRLGTSWSESNR